MFRDVIGAMLLFVGLAFLAAWAISAGGRLIGNELANLVLYGVPACAFALAGAAMLSGGRGRREAGADRRVRDPSRSTGAQGHA